MQWIADNGERILAVLGAAYALALVIVKLTPTPKDDAALEKVSGVVRVIAGLFGLDLKQGRVAPPAAPEKVEKINGAEGA